MVKEYKGWRIDVNDGLGPGWVATSKDYGVWLGLNGYEQDGEILRANTLKDLMQQIDDWEADNA